MLEDENKILKKKIDEISNNFFSKKDGSKKNIADVVIYINSLNSNLILKNIDEKINIINEKNIIYFDYHRLNTNTNYEIELFNNEQKTICIELMIYGKSINLKINRINIIGDIKIPFLIPNE